MANIINEYAEVVLPTNIINVKKIYEEAILPTRAHEDDAGYDLYASSSNDMNTEHSVVIPALKSRKIKTGVAMQIPKGYVGLVFARSGLGINKGITPRNCVGVIDSNYRGEIIVSLHNDNTDKAITIDIGDRIAQIVVVPYYQYELNLVEELSDTDRGENGFGSSGTK